MTPARVASLPLAALLLLGQALSEAACVASSDGIRVAVVARSPATAQPTTFLTDRGYTVKLDRAYACIGAIEILPCARATAARTLGPRVAYAHGSGTATKLATPAVIDLLAGGQSLTIGELAPPTSSYCATRVSLLAADNDALGLPAASMSGRSVLLEGTWSRSGEPPHDLRVWASLAADSTCTIGLDLREAKTVTLVVKPSGQRWFDGIDLATESTASIEAKVVAAIASSMTASVP